MKKILLIIALAIAGILLVGGIVFALSLNSMIKKAVEIGGPKIAQVSVSLDKVKLSPFSGSGTLSGLVVGNPEGFQSEFALKVDHTEVAVAPGSLLSEKIVIKKVHVIGPEITFEGSFNGNNLRTIQANVEKALGSAEKQSPAASTPATEPATPGKKLQIDDFLLSSARLHIRIKELGDKTTTLTLPDIHLSALGQSAEGLSGAEVATKLLTAVRTATTEAVRSNYGNLARSALDTATGTITGTTDTLKDSTNGLLNIFKPK